MKSKKYLALSLIGALMGSMLTFMVMPFFSSQLVTFNKTNASQQIPASTTINVTGKDVNIYKAIVSKAEPSVVGITTANPSLLEAFGEDYGTSGIGTGFIVDSRGYILTNSHVVDDGKAKNVTVLFHDQETAPAEILWFDKLIDLAVIKVEKENLVASDLGDSDNVEVGDIAVAIGNPLGLEFKSSATEGIVSGLERKIQIENADGSISEMTGLIQTSAAINPGNSGGPLLNSQGQVIAINSAKASEGEGLGFAIPINVAKPIVDQFMNNGSFQKVKMGVTVDNAKSFQELHGLDFGIKEGIIILQIEKGSIADKSGFEVHDIILEFDGKKIEDRTDLVRYLYNIKPNDKIKVVVFRDEAKTTIDVKF